MQRLLLTVLSLLVASLPLTAQNVGDQVTAGYQNSRTYLNTDMGRFQPPLDLVRTVNLPGVSDATSLLAFRNVAGPFSNHFLVGESAVGTQPPIRSTAYRLFNADNGALLWRVDFEGGTLDPLDYVPAFSNDVVLLGGPATSTVKAIRVSTGAQLWENGSIGGTSGRYPILTNGLAIYHGSSGVVGADPATGASLWQMATTTAIAPLSFFGQQAYVLDAAGLLHAIDVSSRGNVIPLWSTGIFAGSNPNIISSDRYVFINAPSDNAVSALLAFNGDTLWADSTDALSRTVPLALAYDQLFLFGNDDGAGSASLTALDPDTGAMLWRETESGSGIDFGLIANNVVYYYHRASQRIRARDAFSGRLLWSLRRPNVRGLSAADQSLFVLLADQIEVYGAADTIYFAHLADGGGQRTLLTINNLGRDIADGTVSFFRTNGTPLSLSILGVGTTSNLAFNIPAGATLQIQSAGAAQPSAGWARVTADQPISGSSVFQFSDDGLILNEAGVTDARATGRGILAVQVEVPPDRPQVVDTGVAVANPFNETAVVTYRLLDQDGIEVASVTRVFGAFTQLARFVSDLFAADTSGGFAGTLVIESDNPVVITALRTQAGLQLSSYQVGQ